MSVPVAPVRLCKLTVVTRLLPNGVARAITEQHGRGARVPASPFGKPRSGTGRHGASWRGPGHGGQQRPTLSPFWEAGSGLTFLAVGGWETWEWDESLFEGAAPYYVQGRLPYSPDLVDAMADALGLDGRGRLLDAGCGPGVVTLRLASHFEEVVGLDPDPGMIVEAKRRAAAAGTTNATWVQERAEALPAGLGRFRVVTFAASFHWMDRPRVAAAVKDMLEPGGAAVQVDGQHRPDELRAASARGELPHPLVPTEEVEELRRRYLGPDRRAGQSIRNTSPSGEDEVFQAAGFHPARVVSVPDGRAIEHTVDDIVAGYLSSSGTAPHLFGDRLDQFVAELRQLLEHASPSGRFSVRLPENILRIWSPR